jgi:hypothetical protein
MSTSDAAANSTIDVRSALVNPHTGESAESGPCLFRLSERNATQTRLPVVLRPENRIRCAGAPGALTVDRNDGGN